MKINHLVNFRCVASADFTDAGDALAWFNDRATVGRMEIITEQGRFMHDLTVRGWDLRGRTPMDRAVGGKPERTEFILTAKEREQLHTLGGGSMVQGIRVLLSKL